MGGKRDGCVMNVIHDVLNQTHRMVSFCGKRILIDFFLYHLMRYGSEPKKIYRLAKYAFAEDYDEATILKWLHTFYRRFFAQQFKRSCLPDGPKVGTVSLSPRGDLRMPSDACAELWLEQIASLYK